MHEYCLIREIVFAALHERERTYVGELTVPKFAVCSEKHIRLLRNLQ